MRTGILGGTFDPIHIAHLHAGETALYQARLDRVLFMPAGEPWQKADRRISGAEHRVEMIRLAIEGVDRVRDWTIGKFEREGPTYTIDTLLSFPDDEDLSLILGADAALGTRRPGTAGRRSWSGSSLLVVPQTGHRRPGGAIGAAGCRVPRHGSARDQRHRDP